MTAQTLIELSTLDRVSAIRLFFKKHKELKKSMTYMQNVFIPLLPESIKKNENKNDDSIGTNDPQHDEL